MTPPLMRYCHCDPASLLDTVDGDSALYLELSSIFLRESVDQYAALVRAAGQGDLEQLGRHSHALKGTVGPLGATLLIGMLAAIEQECRQGQCRCGPERLGRLAHELAQARTEIAHFRAQLAAAAP